MVSTAFDPVAARHSKYAIAVTTSSSLGRRHVLQNWCAASTSGKGRFEAREGWSEAEPFSYHGDM